MRRDAGRRARTLDEEVLAVQRLYPQIFFACHTQHVRRSSTPFALSEQDSSVLSHLDRRTGMRPGALAAHLGVRPSSLSATIARLLRLRCIERSRSALDRRGAELRLTDEGVRALQETSVLDRRRVELALARLPAAARAAAVAGLALLARGCNELMLERGSATRWTRRPAHRRRESAV